VKNTNSKNYRRLKRKEMLEQGVFDGRYKTKLIKDKKKENNKKSCRKFKYKK